MAASSAALEAAATDPTLPHKPVSRPQIEIVISRSVAFFGLIFGAQTVPAMLGQAPEMRDAWVFSFVLAIFGGLLLAVVASIVQRFVQAVNTYIALIYLVAMLTWPWAVLDAAATSSGRPWLWYLCTLATAAAAVALSTWAATVYLFLAPLSYAVIRVTPSGGGARWDAALLDAVYAIILGGAVLILMTLLRSAAASVDAAQTTALARYSHAVRQHATEVERVQVDSIVHDSVLTTLLSAASASRPDSEALAARMAASAIGHLKDAAAASPDDETTVPLSQVASRIVGATATLSAPFAVRGTVDDPRGIPVQAADAVYSASVQAMVNSLQHAGSAPSIERWLSVASTGSGGLEVQVGDTGAGFDPSAVTMGRLGLRVSIVERVTNAGGNVRIDSSPGRGTVIVIVWPAPGAAEVDS
ncbi:MAG TPA: ATP-binding protein [Microbacteriaceae bacterium]